MPLEYTILHTNDFHNKLSEPQAERLRGLRSAIGDRGLLLDAGDAIGSGNITFRPGGEPFTFRESECTVKYRAPDFQFFAPM